MSLESPSILSWRWVLANQIRVGVCLIQWSLATFLFCPPWRAGNWYYQGKCIRGNGSHGGGCSFWDGLQLVNHWERTGEPSPACSGWCFAIGLAQSRSCLRAGFPQASGPAGWLRHPRVFEKWRIISTVISKVMPLIWQRENLKRREVVTYVESCFLSSAEQELESKALDSLHFLPVKGLKAYCF